MPAHDDTMHANAPIDALSGADALSVMLASHIAALEAARGAIGQINQAAGIVAAAFEGGRTVHYAAAGSSGLMALADASELPGTFRVPHDQIRIFMAGGVPVDGRMPGDTEDSEAEAVTAASEVNTDDVALVISASGTTPYALAFARLASERGAQVVGIANVAGSDLLRLSDVAIALNTPPEVLEGSTRLGAGTAQKAVLNMISTQAGVLMGHVHDGLMVNVYPDNLKLRHRAADTVVRIAGVTNAVAERALVQAGYDTKRATLVATGMTPADAQTLLDQHKGRLRACLAASI